jgi:hypothetical protein
LICNHRFEIADDCIAILKKFGNVPSNSHRVSQPVSSSALWL